MAEIEKNKAGLQKKVSSVFKGVPLPQNGGIQQKAGTPASDAPPGASAGTTPADRQSTQGALLKALHQGYGPSSATPSRVLPQGIPYGTSGRTPQEDGGTPEHPVTAQSKPAPADRQVFQRPAPKKPLKAAAPAKPHKTSVVTEPTGPSLWQQINDKLFASKPGGSPARQKAMVILVPVLALVMVFMFRHVLSTSPGKTQAATDDAPIIAKAKSSHDIDWQIPEPLPAIERDPTKLPAEQVAVATSAEPNQTVAEPRTEVIDVRDIVYSDDKPSAVVNGRIVYVGHKVGSATVVQIFRDGVEFERDGQRWKQTIHD